jgi:hypothetical protein
MLAGIPLSHSLFALWVVVDKPEAHSGVAQTEGVSQDRLKVHRHEEFENACCRLSNRMSDYLDPLVSRIGMTRRERGCPKQIQLHCI